MTVNACWDMYYTDMASVPDTPERKAYLSQLKV